MRWRTQLAIVVAQALTLSALPAQPHLHASTLAVLSDADTTRNGSALRVHLVDYAAVPQIEANLAESEASRLWRGIGVDLTWSAGEPTPTSAVVPSSQRTGTPALDVTVVMLRRDMAKRMILAEHRGDGVLGRAVPEALRAYIFFDRVNSASDRFGVRRGEVLGRVVAHELAHLLLGHTHSKAGLFRAEPDLASPAVAFDPRDGATIRARLSDREGH